MIFEVLLWHGLIYGNECNIPNGWFTVLNSLELSDPEHSGSHALITPAAGWELRLDLWQGDWPREVPEDWGQVLITDRGGALGTRTVRDQCHEGTTTASIHGITEMK